MQAVKGLNKACGVILHSDQGGQYQMVAYRRILAEHGIIQSMSRKGKGMAWTMPQWKVSLGD